MQIVTKTLQKLGMNDKQEINHSQRTLLDIKEEEYPMWDSLSLGKELSDARAELFVLLRGLDDKASQEQLIANYKALQKFRKEEASRSQEERREENLQKRSHVIIYCDGGSTPNPGKSGSGISIYRDNKLSELWYGLYEEMGTNNTAELGALYEALCLAQKELQNGNSVEIKSDSMYAINCIKTWALSWERNGWKKKGGEIKNLDIIQEAYDLYNRIKKDVQLTHIKAHAGFEGNELADRMTMYAIEQKSKKFVKYTKKIDVASILKMRAG